MYQNWFPTGSHNKKKAQQWLNSIAFIGAEIQNHVPPGNLEAGKASAWKFSGLLFSLFFYSIKKTVSGFPGSGERGSEGGLDGRRTWRRSSWTGRPSCHAGLGSSCPSGWSRGERSCLPSPCQLRNRRNDRLFLVGRSLRCRNVSSLTSSTVSGSSSGCFLFSRRSASTPVNPYLKEMFSRKQKKMFFLHCGVCGRVRKHCRLVPRLCFSSKESLLLSHNLCKMCPLSSLKTEKKRIFC